MKLRSFRLKNYKSFLDTGRVELMPDMNVVTGQNNAGKTALLQALELAFEAAPHRSIASLPEPRPLSNVTSQVEFTIAISGEELVDLSDPPGTLIFAIPPVQLSPFRTAPNQPDYLAAKGLQQAWDWLVGHDEIKFNLVRLVSSSTPAHFSASTRPSHGLYRLGEANAGNYINAVRHRQEDGSVVFHVQSGADVDLGVSLADQLASRIYRFSAERFNLGNSRFGTSETLARNALNLPEVLNVLQTANPTRYNEFISLVREILPQVEWVSVEPLSDQMLRIRVWPVKMDTGRTDLAVPLTDSGTGIGQVLGLVYVAFNSPQSRVILIDEPQSFLHPGAARKLIEVLKRFPQHQYVISTHSPTVITAAEAKEILVLRCNEGQTTIEVADAGDTKNQKTFLDEVGARLSDVFGMDQVLWVEGPTEEKAIPQLLDRLDIPRTGTAILAIRNTGDLEGRDARKVFEIYRNLTGKASIMPPTIAFLLDSEHRTDAEKKEITTLSGGMARFLPRRTFENYLLNPEAIAATVNSIPGFSDSGPIAPDVVVACLHNLIRDNRAWRPFQVPTNPDLEEPRLNGAVVLSELFRTLSDRRFFYKKTEHSVSIFRWLLQHDLKNLSDLSAFITSVLNHAAGQ